MQHKFSMIACLSLFGFGKDVRTDMQFNMKLFGDVYNNNNSRRFLIYT